MGKLWQLQRSARISSSWCSLFRYDILEWNFIFILKHRSDEIWNFWSNKCKASELYLWLKFIRYISKYSVIIVLIQISYYWLTWSSMFTGTAAAGWAGSCRPAWARCGRRGRGRGRGCPAPQPRTRSRSWSRTPAQRASVLCPLSSPWCEPPGWWWRCCRTPWPLGWQWQSYKQIVKCMWLCILVKMQFAVMHCLCGLLEIFPFYLHI